MTQKRLAALAGVSQAHVAKIENGKVDPRLSTVNKVLQVLTEWRKKKCVDIMTRGVLFTRAQDRILDVSEKMVSHGISQVPVLDGNRVVGTVTEESIMSLLGKDILNETVEKVMDSPLPFADEEEDIERISELLRNHQGVLVSRGKRIIGIITRSDLLRVIGEPI